MKIIGLIGPKGSGKDTVFELLQAEGKIADKISFAGPLKRICAEVFNLDEKLFHDPALKEALLPEAIQLTGQHLQHVLFACEDYLEKPFRLSVEGAKRMKEMSGLIYTTPRQILQHIGTDFIRNAVYEKFHVEAAFSPLALSGFDHTKTYAVTDIRFMDELVHLEKTFQRSFQAYYVQRPKAESSISVLSHASELGCLQMKELPSVEIIDNSGDLEDLKQLLKGFKV